MNALRSFICAVALVTSASQLQAQARPVLLVHGFSSGPGTWDNVRSILSSETGFTFPNPVTLSASQPIPYQANQLLVYKNGGSYGPNAIFVGHSQGGLVSRYAHRTDSVSGLVTIGTPHAGADIAGSVGTFATYLLEAAVASGSVAYLSDLDTFDEHYLTAQSAMSHALSAQALFLAVTDVALFWIFSDNAALNDMTPGSALLSGALGINTNPGLEKIGARHAIASVIDGGYDGGPARLFLNAQDSEAVGEDLLLWAYQLESDGLDLWNITGGWHVIAVFGLLDLSALIGNFAGFWHYDVVGGIPNDVVVPAGSALALPNFNTTWQITGPSHFDETKFVAGAEAIRLRLRLIL